MPQVRSHHFLRRKLACFTNRCRRWIRLDCVSRSQAPKGREPGLAVLGFSIRVQLVGLSWKMLPLSTSFFWDGQQGLSDLSSAISDTNIMNHVGALLLKSSNLNWGPTCFFGIRGYQLRASYAIFWAGKTRLVTSKEFLRCNQPGTHMRPWAFNWVWVKILARRWYPSTWVRSWGYFDGYHTV